GCFGLSRYSLRRGEVYAVSILQITEGIVAGDDAAAIGGNLGDEVAHLTLECIELGEIGGGVGIVRVLAGWIGGDQRVADIGDVDLCIGDRLPGVRVRASVVVIVSMVADALARLDAGGRDHDR